MSAVPQTILDAILDEAANQAGIAGDQLTIERAEAVVWNDGSLGCPAPDEFYSQALVNGYWVIVQAGDQTYDFRVGSDSSFKFCPPGQGNPPVDAPDIY